MGLSREREMRGGSMEDPVSGQETSPTRWWGTASNKRNPGGREGWGDDILPPLHLPFFREPYEVLDIKEENL